MAKKICLQAGHLNTTTSATGAPGEMKFNQDMVNRLALIFKSIPEIDVYITDANSFNDKKVVTTDWDLFLSVHYDADIYNDSGGFIDFPEPSTDKATKESQRIANVIGDTYFALSGIKRVQRRSNANTRYYYMWKYLTAKTPCNIIECGVGWRRPDDFEKLNTPEGRDMIARAITKSICNAFDVEYSFDDKDDEQQHEDYENLKQKAGYYDEIRKEIGIKEDKYSLTSQRIADLLKKESDYDNRDEQVDRLKGQITLLQKQIEDLSSDNSGVLDRLNETIKQLHEQINQLGKDKGALNDRITELKSELEECRKNPESAEETLNLIQRILALFYSTRQ